VRGRDLGFATAFGGVQPRRIQTAVTEPPANVLVLEAETGSGKTEAALWRFVHLFERGLVNGLYFALPRALRRLRSSGA